MRRQRPTILLISLRASWFWAAKHCAAFMSTSAAQMDAAELEKQIAQDKAAGFTPFCIVATAGTTNSGAIDDLVKLAEIAKRHDLWLHVDGAYGAAAIFSDQHRELVRGIELADSVTIDPHKWLAMPFAAGVVLTWHPEVLQQAFATSTPYMPKMAATGSAPCSITFRSARSGRGG